MEITQIRVFPVQEDKLKAFVSVVLDGCFVVSDIKMPGMDGIELLQKIKRENPETEVVMITGHGDMDLAIKSLKFEATDFITKPINVEALEIALKRVQDKIVMKRQLKTYTQNLEALVRDYPGYVNGWFNLAVVHYQSGSYSAAMAAVTR